MPKHRHPPTTHYKFIPRKKILLPPLHPLPPQGWALGSPLAPAVPALGGGFGLVERGGGGKDLTNKKTTNRKKSDLMLRAGGRSRLISWLWQSCGEG